MKKIVIVGGGFAGASVLLGLTKAKVDAKITLIDKSPFLEYTPSLHLGINMNKYLKKIKIPLKRYYGDCIVEEEVTNISQKIVKTNKNEYPFDYLVLATGARTNFYGNKEFRKYALPFNKIEHVKEVNKRLEEANTITIIGGGYTGVEIASVLASQTTKKIQVVHAKDRLLERLSEKVSRLSEAYLKKKGCEIHYNDRMIDCDKTSVTLQSGEKLQSDMTILCAGMKPNEELCGNHIELTNLLAVKNNPSIFVCGDCGKSDLIPTAHNAMLEGRAVAEHLIELLAQKKAKIIKNKQPPLIIALGRYHGILTWGNKGFSFPLSGLVKWIIEKRVLLEYKAMMLLPL